MKFNEEKKKQNTQSDYGPKPFTNNQNASIFKMTGSPNKNLKATANMYNNQIVKNNYDKMNLEEQEMLVHKMQSDFNIMGYRDSDGYRLKTDGKYGNKTKSAYEQYKKDNKEDYDDYNEFKKQEDKGYSILKEI